MSDDGSLFPTDIMHIRLRWLDKPIKLASHLQNDAPPAQDWIIILESPRFVVNLVSP